MRGPFRRNGDSKRCSVGIRRGREVWYEQYRLFLFIGDLVLIVLALLVAQFARFGGPVGSVAVGPRVFDYEIVGVVVEMIWVAALSATDSRGRRVVGIGLEEYRRVINATLGAFGIVAILSYLLRIELSRFYFAVALPLGLVLLLAGRVAWRFWLARLRRRGRGVTGAIVVGKVVEVRQTLLDLKRHPEAGYVARGVSLVDGGGEDSGELVLVSRSDLRTAVVESGVGAVIVAGGLPRFDIRLLAWQLEDSGVELMLVPQLTDVAGPRVHSSPVQNLPLVHVDLPQFSGFNHVMKRLLDVVFSAVALVLLAPILGVIAVAIKREDGGPVIFRQERVGQNGATFTMHKFRSMAVDAEARLEELRRQSEGNGVLFKMKSDPRVTTVGGFLRKYSLDELPQFWDVLVGSMSVVGPRPPLATEVATYAEHVRRRLLTKPGITGLWQVSGRSDLTWDESVRLDLSYVENWSITGDIVIIFKTVRAVLRPSGAY